MSDKTTKQIDDQMRFNRSIWRDTYKKSEMYNTGKSIKYKKYVSDDDQEFSKAVMERKREVRDKVVKVFHASVYDVLQAVEKVGIKGTLVVNPGSNNYPIEGAAKGAFGTEMDLFRRTNYFLAIDEGSYPILEDQCIYSPTVVLFKNAEFRKMDQPISFGILNIPPLHSPRLISMQNPNGKGYIESFDNTNDLEKMTRKIEMIFKIAILHNHKTIIMTNYGGGTDRNPTEKVIELFNDAITKYPINQVFFAIKTHEQRTKDKEFIIYHKLVQR